MTPQDITQLVLAGIGLVSPLLIVAASLVAYGRGQQKVESRLEALHREDERLREQLNDATGAAASAADQAAKAAHTAAQAGQGISRVLHDLETTTSNLRNLIDYLTERDHQVRRKVNRHRDWIHALDKRLALLVQQVNLAHGHTGHAIPRMVTDDDSTPLDIEEP